MTAPRDCIHLERTHAFADGELAGATADDARDHLATCEACQAELADVLQLDAAVADRKAAGVISLAWYRRRQLQIAGVALAAAAGVAIFVGLPHRGARVETQQVAVALAPRRAVEARLAWHGAADYRAYDVPRAGDATHESVAMRTLADLEARGDLHGVGALALLNGDRQRAADYLARAGDSADALADRAALALADQRPELALALADAALAKDAGHGAARWNRALALRDLGLSRAAAAAFREVAGRGEPGWAVEARQRAAVIDAGSDDLQQRFERLERARPALARGPIDASLADAAGALPGSARGLVYDAIRSAATPAQLAALQPVADAIDRTGRDTPMRDALSRAGAALHPALSRRYGELARAEAPLPTGAARRQFLAELRAAHADDLLIGALVLLSDDHQVVNRDDVAELARLTAASPDPWMQLLGLDQQAQAALAANDLAGAEAALLRAQQRCAEAQAPALRCALIGQHLGDVYLKSQRIPEARAALFAAWKLARTAGEWAAQRSLLASLAALPAQADDPTGTALPLSRAYNDEKALRSR